MNERGNVIIAVIVGLVVGLGAGYLAANSKASPTAMKETATQRESQGLSASADPEAKIKNAASAAPENIAKDATVLDYPTAEGKDFATLRAGTNGWTCLPDDPSSPANDPVCVDKEGMNFFQAWMTKAKPKLAQAGIGYMLQGGGSASNSDPFATKPADGEMWMHEPPHLMVFTTTPPDAKIYSTDPNSGGPWVMWAGTPYAHLMIPVK